MRGFDDGVNTIIFTDGEWKRLKRLLFSSVNLHQGLNVLVDLKDVKVNKKSVIFGTTF